MSLPSPPNPEPVRPWRDALRVYLEVATLRMFALGFSAGLPLLLVMGTMGFRLRQAGIEPTTIGYLSWVGLAYAFKWVWAPLVDRVPLPPLTTLLGRRRGWLLLAQTLVITGITGMALFDPRQGLTPLVACALLTAFGSATQDIALDALRIESASTDKQPALAAAYQTGYRLAMIWSGAGVLWIVANAKLPGMTGYHDAGWRVAYFVMAASMLAGMLTVLLSSEPQRTPLPSPRHFREWIRSVLIEPFADFLRRHRWHAVLILALIAVYRISDVVMGVMANPFYVDMGFTEGEVAAVSKVFGVAMTLLGAFIGGVLSVRLGVMRVLMGGAVASVIGNLLFAWLATRGHDLHALIAVVSADNLAGGIASAAFVGYLSSLTNVNYSATQYALFSSMMLLFPKFIAGFAGRFVDAFGYQAFFMSTALLGAPVLILVVLAARSARARH